MNVARIIQIGSRKPYLQLITFEIFKHCLKYDIELTTQWIPKTKYICSKFVDYNDWGIDFETFNFIQEKFGKFTIDRFSSNTNRKLDHFNSKYFCPDTGGVDAFTMNWSNHFNWLCPPITLIGETLRHMKICHAKGVLLIPEWKSAYYWPLLSKKLFCVRLFDFTSLLYNII